MYRAALVDDEIWSLRGLSSIFPWEKEGFEIVVQETDPLEALRRINGAAPDVVFTDIRMPELSGLELMASVLKEHPGTVFVIISGHNDFQYVREALRQGAFDYFLKPIDMDECGRLLGRIREKLDSRRMDGDAALYAQLLLGKADPSEALVMADDGGPYRAAAFASGDDALPDVPAALLSLPSSVAEAKDLRVSRRKALLVMKGDAAAEVLIQEFAERSRRYPRVHIGLSKTCTSLAELPQLLLEADMASSGYFFHRPAGAEMFTSAPSEVLEDTLRRFEAALASCDREKIAYLLDRLPGALRREPVNVYHLVYFWNRLQHILMEWCPQGDAERIFETVDAYRLPEKYADIGDFMRCLKEKAAAFIAAAPLMAIGCGGANPRFLRILEKIQRNYRSKLRLEDLAEEQQLNVSYCCELFKKHTQGTFSEYVSRLRMNKAWEMIAAGEASPEETADFLGYGDYYYFSRVFKKTFQIAPSRLRSQKDTGKKPLSAHRPSARPPQDRETERRPRTGEAQQ